MVSYLISSKIPQVQVGQILSASLGFVWKFCEVDGGFLWLL